MARQNGPTHQTRMLDTALIHCRPFLSEKEFAHRSNLAPGQLHKYRSGHRHPRVDEWPEIIRTAAGVSDLAGGLLAQVVLPGELYVARRHSGNSSSLGEEVIQAGAAFGDVAQAYMDATRDGKINPSELDRIEQAYIAAEIQVSEGLQRIRELRRARRERVLQHRGIWASGKPRP